MLATKDVTVFCFRSIHKAVQPVGCLIESRKDLGRTNATRGEQKPPEAVIKFGVTCQTL